MKIGLIGFGRLGKLINRYLGTDCDLIIYDNLKNNIPTNKQSTLREICDASIIIIAVPISHFESCIDEIKNMLIGKDCLIVDVCSVKVRPVEIMKEKLPSTVSILGTHPMFGPDSAKDTLFGNKIVLSPERIEKNLYKGITLYLQKHGIKVIEATPSKHDQEIANSLNLTHLIGRALMNFNAQSLDIDTKGYRRLMKILETVENDSEQLFIDMNTYNPYSKETRDKFMHSLTQTIKSIES